MSVHLDWDNAEHSIILADIDWPYTWDDLTAEWKTAAGMIESVSHSVHVIVVGKSSQFPSGNPLTNLQQVMQPLPDNLGLVFFVSENRFAGVINTMLFKLIPRLSKRGHVVLTLKQAYDIIKRETGVPGETP